MTASTWLSIWRKLVVSLPVFFAQLSAPVLPFACAGPHAAAGKACGNRVQRGFGIAKDGDFRGMRPGQRGLGSISMRIRFLSR